MIQPIDPGRKFAVMHGKEVLEEFGGGCIALLYSIFLPDITEPFLPDVLDMEPGKGFSCPIRPGFIDPASSDSCF